MGYRTKKSLTAKMHRERKARIILHQRGYRLQKSRSRSWRSVMFGRYRIVTAEGVTVLASAHHQAYQFSFEDVEDWIARNLTAAVA